jgi:hypothetical protein
MRRSTPTVQLGLELYKCYTSNLFLSLLQCSPIYLSILWSLSQIEIGADSEKAPVSSKHLTTNLPVIGFALNFDPVGVVIFIVDLVDDFKT